MKELEQKETPKPLFDTVVETAVSKFRTQESFLEPDGERSGYTLTHATSDAIEEITKGPHNSYEVFMELANKSAVKPTDLNLESVAYYGSESWDEFLNVTSGLILKRVIEDLSPDLAEESERRYNQFA